MRKTASATLLCLLLCQASALTFAGAFNFIPFGESGFFSKPAGRNREAFERLCRKLKGLELEALRSAVEDLVRTFPEKYSSGEEFLSRLRKYKKEIEAFCQGKRRPAEETLNRGSSLYSKVEKLRREALIANPLVSGRPILFVVRNQYKPDHHNTATIFQTGEVNTGSFEGGGALKTLHLGGSGKVEVLLEDSKAVYRDTEVSFDGKRILFSMRRNIEDDYHLYEVKADGSDLRQLTFGSGVSDIDPLYLPNGKIVFSSTREPKYCMCNQHIMANLFCMEPDGSNIRQLGKSTLFEGHAALTPQGRVIYDRWEYVDRNFGDAQGLWTVNPDGTNHAVFWGNNINSPGAVLDPRFLPGTGKVICTFSSCHDRPWGALAVLDRRYGLDSKEAVVRTWPPDAVDLVGKGNWDTYKRVRPKYEDPYPLNDKYFLCARMTGKGEETGIYLLDVFGNEILLHAEAPGCFDPMPLSARPRPPVIPPRRDYKGGNGYFYVQDVYEGTHMRGVERGEVKYLRVVESPEKRYFTDPAWNGQGVERPAMNWHNFINKRILGTVPVREDGSAYFEVPSRKFVYFQLLDEKRMMIQSMRSGTMVQSGETTGCIGCHENRLTAPPPVGEEIPQALREPPGELKGWFGKPRRFSYMDEVQPVFTKACVQCHDYGKKAGKVLNLAPDRSNTFNTSYIELWRKGYIKCVGAGPAEIQQAYSWGSHASKIVEVIQEGNTGEKLSDEDFVRIVTWIDLNGPYYPRYASAYPDNLSGRSPLTNSELKRLEKLTGVKLRKLADHRRKMGAQICFERPQLSPCLSAIDSEESDRYKEAVSIIRRGYKRLKERPRADMPGFTPCEVDRRRLSKYRRLRQAELSSRKAVRNEGKK